MAADEVARVLIAMESEQVRRGVARRDIPPMSESQLTDYERDMLVTLARRVGELPPADHPGSFGIRQRLYAIVLAYCWPRLADPIVADCLEMWAAGQGWPSERLVAA